MSRQLDIWQGAQPPEHSLGHQDSIHGLLETHLGTSVLCHLPMCWELPRHFSTVRHIFENLHRTSSSAVNREKSAVVSVIREDSFLPIISESPLVRFGNFVDPPYVKKANRPEGWLAFYSALRPLFWILPIKIDIGGGGFRKRHANLIFLTTRQEKQSLLHHYESAKAETAASAN